MVHNLLTLYRLKLANLLHSAHLHQGGSTHSHLAPVLVLVRTRGPQVLALLAHGPVAVVRPAAHGAVAVGPTYTPQTQTQVALDHLLCGSWCGSCSQGRSQATHHHHGPWARRWARTSCSCPSLCPRPRARAPGPPPPHAAARAPLRVGVPSDARVSS
jgi:hypothetical protein